MTTLETWPADVGIVLVDHGSKLEAANRMLEDMADLYARATGTAIVEPAHMELAEPSIRQAVARCIDRGAARVVVLPFFLSPGRHSQRDIPALVAEADAAHPDVPVWVAGHMGVDERLCDVLQRRAFESLAARDEEARR